VAALSHRTVERPLLWELASRTRKGNARLSVSNRAARERTLEEVDRSTHLNAPGALAAASFRWLDPCFRFLHERRRCARSLV
jgi:hypothetical protein